MLEDVDRKWLLRLLGDGVKFNEPMAPHTSFKIGGPADAWVQPESERQLKAVLEWTRQKNIPYLIVGGGTNLLVRDGGIRGLVIHVRRLAMEVKWHRHQQRIQLTAGAGIPTKRLCALALKQGWEGMNFALGIPGTLGGAIIMNAGTAHGCLADVIDSVMVMTAKGEKIELQRSSLSYAYRRLQMPKDFVQAKGAPAILIAAQLSLTLGDRDMLRKQARQWMGQRSKKQPTWQPSAGCYFKNPSKEQSAGWLIDKAGLKGWRIGGAQVSNRHANFIINRGGACASDVLNIAAKIQETVRARFDIDLIPEVHIVGEEKTGA